jgi:uncharacterized protein YxjI
MNTELSRNLFLVKEHTGIFKAANNYDILDPQTGQVVLHCREENLGPLTKLLRFTDYKRMTPFDVSIRTVTGQPVLSVTRGISIVLSNVSVLDEHGQRVGGFKQKFFSVGGKFDVLDASERVVCTLQGKWTGWDFKFVAPDGTVLAQVTKKWAGLGKEMFTSADNYAMTISDAVPADDTRRMLMMGAVMCIDMVLKE